MRSILNNKRGQVAGIIIGLIVTVAVLIVVMTIVSSTGWYKNLSGDLLTGENLEGDSFAEVTGNDSFRWFDYIFGKIPTGIRDVAANDISAIIVIVGMWLLFFITFGDILSMFSTFSKPVAWAAAFLIALVAANLKFISWILVFAVGLFAWAGSAAVLVGMAASFVVFIAINLGIYPLRHWLQERTKVMAGAKGAKRAAAGIRVARTMGREARKAGK